jgi:hypothetical protein
MHHLLFALYGLSILLTGRDEDNPWGEIRTQNHHEAAELLH